MFGGEEEKVHILCRNEFAGIMIDRFGKEVPLRKTDAEHFEISVEVAVSGIFLGWIMGLGDGVRITGPEHVVEMMQEEVRRLVRTYE